MDSAAATIFILQNEHFAEVNAAAEALTGYSRDELLAMHFLEVVHPEFRDLVGSRAAARVRGENPPQRYEFKILRKDGEERWIDLTVGRTTFRGRPALIDSVWDVTERKRAEAKLAQQNRLYRTLSAINQVLVRAGNPEEMLAETCRILVETGGYRLAWVGVPQPSSGLVLPAFRAGVASQYLDVMDIRLDESGGQAPVIRCLRQGRVAVVQNTQEDPAFGPWQEPARTHGLLSAAAFPLRVRGEVVSALGVYASEPNAFGPEETALLEELAGDLEYALTAFQDRRERETAETALRESETRFRLLFERNVAGVFRTTQEGQILDCNESFARIFGAESEEEMKRHSAIEVFPSPEDRRAYLADLHPGGQLTNVEWLGRRLDGSPIWLLENVTLVEDPRFEMPVMEGTMIDITELKAAEQALRESEARFRTLAETSAAGILVFQGDHFVYANPSVLQIGESSEEELKAMAFWAAAHPRFQEQVCELGHACLAGEFAPRRFELQIVTKRGRTRWVDCTLARAQMGGRPAGVVTLVDITERRRAERLQTALYAIAQASLLSDSLNQFLPAVHEALKQIVPCRNFCVTLADAAEGGLGCAYVEDEKQPGVAELREAKGAVEWVMRRGEPLLADRTRLSELAASGEISPDPAGCTGWLGVPLRLKDRVLGVMGVWSYRKVARFEAHHQKALTLVAGQVAMAIERMRGEEALRESEQKFRMLAESSAAGILIYQSEQILYGNPAAWAMTGYSRDEFSRLKFWELVHPDHREMVKARGMARQRGENVPPRYEFMIVTKGGEARWVDYTAGLISYGGQKASVGMAFDVTERKKAEARLAHLAHYDTLTGLPNRALLYDRLGRHLERCAQESERLAVICLGLDRFKEINDTAGQEVGDELLRETGRRLALHMETLGEVARLGSDEFVLVLAGSENAGKVDSCLRSLLEGFRRPMRAGSCDFHLGFSAGVSFYPEDAAAPEGLLRRADIAMSRAKSMGGGSVEFFTETMSLLVSERADLRQRLRRALANGELEAYYQPIMESSSGLITSTEALIRWRQRDGEMILPGRFIGVAEETELILSLDQWMLRTACSQRKAWNDKGFPAIPVSVNLSARQFLRPGVSEMVKRILDETGLPPSQLVLEITEATAMWDVTSTISLLQELKEMGVDTAIDDFGSGYSSLMYLKQLPVRFLKVPQLFIQELPLNLSDVAIVRAIIGMAHGLHLSVTAEGVATREQLEFLAGIGCDMVQGFFCCHPLPACSLSEILAR